MVIPMEIHNEVKSQSMPATMKQQSTLEKETPNTRPDAALETRFIRIYVPTNTPQSSEGPDTNKSATRWARTPTTSSLPTTPSWDRLGGDLQNPNTSSRK